MPKTLLIVCITLIGAFLAKAGIAPFYETGFARYTTPAIAIAMALLVAMFMARKRWTWSYIFWMAILFPILTLVFPPKAQIFGALTGTGQAIAFVEGVSCLVIFIFVLRSETRYWFSAAPAKRDASR